MELIPGFSLRKAADVLRACPGDLFSFGWVARAQCRGREFGCSGLKNQVVKIKPHQAGISFSHSKRKRKCIQNSLTPIWDWSQAMCKSYDASAANRTWNPRH